MLDYGILDYTVLCYTFLYNAVLYYTTQYLMQPGPNTRKHKGVYGNQGQFHSDNNPGVSFNAVSWYVLWRS